MAHQEVCILECIFFFLVGGGGGGFNFGEPLICQLLSSKQMLQTAKCWGESLLFVIPSVCVCVRVRACVWCVCARACHGSLKPLV